MEVKEVVRTLFEEKLDKKLDLYEESLLDIFDQMVKDRTYKFSHSMVYEIVLKFIEPVYEYLPEELQLIYDLYKKGVSVQEKIIMITSKGLTVSATIDDLIDASVKVMNIINKIQIPLDELETI